MRLYLDSGLWRMPWKVVLHPSWQRNWIDPSPITLLIVEFHMKTSPPWTEVYEQNIFLLELICCEHSESIIYLFLLPTDQFVTDRTSHLSSSPSVSSMTLTSCYFFLWVQQSALMCPLLVTPVVHQNFVFWVTCETSIITHLLCKVSLPGIIAMRLTRQLVVDFFLIEQMHLYLIDFGCSYNISSNRKMFSS